MKTWGAVFGVFYTLLIQTVWAQGTSCGDAYDGVLCAKYLSEEQERLFEISDSLPSAFWDDWAGNDYAELLPPGSCSQSPEVGCGAITGPSDAALTVRSAASARGLYVLAVVTDDDWVCPGRTDLQNSSDNLTLQFNQYSRTEMYSQSFCGLLGCEYWMILYTTFLLYVPVPASDLSCNSTITFGYYDSYVWSWQMVTVDDSSFTRRGIAIKRVRLTDTTWYTEIFIPWTTYFDGFSNSVLLDARGVGFTTGFNDYDSDSGAVGALWWLGRNPLFPGSEYGSMDITSWGDIALPQEGLGGVSVKVSDASRAGHVTSGNRNRTNTVAIFDLRGRLVAQTRTASERLPHRGTKLYAKNNVLIIQPR